MFVYFCATTVANRLADQTWIDSAFDQPNTICGYWPSLTVQSSFYVRAIYD